MFPRVLRPSFFCRIPLRSARYLSLQHSAGAATTVKASSRHAVYCNNSKSSYLTTAAECCRPIAYCALPTPKKKVLRSVAQVGRYALSSAMLSCASTVSSLVRTRSRTLQVVLGTTNLVKEITGSTGYTASGALSTDLNFFKDRCISIRTCESAGKPSYAVVRPYKPSQPAASGLDTDAQLPQVPFPRADRTVLCVAVTLLLLAFGCNCVVFACGVPVNNC